jgi:HIV Tat-specific factor 1
LLTLYRKLAEWSDDDEEVATKTFAPPTNKYSKIVLVRHAFTLELLKSDLDAYGDIKDDMEDEAKTFGEITNVTLYDREPDGILSVKFKDADAAEKFKERIHGRNYDGRKLVAEIATERPKFKKSGTGTASDEEEEAERLERFVTGGSKRESKGEEA